MTNTRETTGSDKTPVALDQLHQGLYTRIGKRVFDVTFSIIALSLMFPIIVMLSVLSKAGTGSVFFGHTRIGQNGRPFTCWKIRTMVPDAEDRLQDMLDTDPVVRAQWGRYFKLDNDPRITRIGAVLKKTSLDELPQFWNVIRGQMSVVGPRPVTSDEIGWYGQAAGVVLSMKPGITGLWQVSGRNDIDYETRIKLDLSYAQEVSLLTDLSIIRKTVITVIKRSGQ